MSDRFTDLLSDYMDHDLPRGEAEALERHLAGCAECRDTLAALERVKARAAALVDPPAPTDLWAGIASRIGTAGSTSVGPRPFVVRELPRRASVWSVPQWALAAAAFAIVALGVSWMVQNRVTPALRPAAGPSASTPAAPVLTLGADAESASFDAAAIESQIGQLRQSLDRDRDKLDPKTVQVLEENLRIIHKATEDARRALERDPANRELRQYFAGSVQSKLDLVRRAAQLAGV
jgi:anti-sigma factor RsiW